MDVALDRLGRPLRDLRISVTDRCNFRCRYCMPREEFGKGHDFLPKTEILTYEEIRNFVKACEPLGLRKVRITGGEPLLRKDIHHLVRQLSSMEMEVALTTNGSLLGNNAANLAQSGLSRVTISLDAIDQEVHSKITDSKVPVTDILDGISAATRYELGPVKVNCVVQRGVNEHQIPKLVRKFRGTGVIVRFIEFMDVGSTNGWTQGQVVPTSEIIDFLSSEFDLTPLARKSASDVASRWAHSDGSGEIGFISSVSQPFCGDCVRARLSSDGKFFTCLFTTTGHDMSALIRSGGKTEVLTQSIEEVWSARKDRYSEERTSVAISLPRVEMSYIGG
ncbi:MAG: cyclic pyranopterin monophosphate synthase [Methanobacteriota archaeon]|nr:MAG: cyclic pyranopterin monophosphate synthase [Euryarchaeota archaeon]